MAATDKQIAFGSPVTQDLGTRARGGKRGRFSSSFGGVVDSNSDNIQNMLAAMDGYVSVIDILGGEISVVPNAVKESFRDSWYAVANWWTIEVSEGIDEVARANKAFPKKHWTGFLYSGGNPDNIGRSDRRLFEMVPSSTASSFSVRPTILEDRGNSYSPIAETTISRSGKPYDPWPERAMFMLGKYAGKRDYKKLYGRRTKQDLAQGKPLYISEIGFMEGEVMMSDRFSDDYGSVKAERNAELNAITQGITATKILAGLDREFRKVVDESIKGGFSKLGEQVESRARAYGIDASVSGGAYSRKFQSSGGKGRSYGSGAARDQSAKLFAAVFAARMKKLAARGGDS